MRKGYISFFLNYIHDDCFKYFQIRSMVPLIEGVCSSKSSCRVYVPVCCSVLQCVVACCSVLQRVVVCCSVLQCVDWGLISLDSTSRFYVHTKSHNESTCTHAIIFQRRVHRRGGRSNLRRLNVCLNSHSRGFFFVYKGLSLTQRTLSHTHTQHALSTITSNTHTLTFPLTLSLTLSQEALPSLQRFALVSSKVGEGVLLSRNLFSNLHLDSHISRFFFFTHGYVCEIAWQFVPCCSDFASGWCMPSTLDAPHICVLQWLSLFLKVSQCFFEWGRACRPVSTCSNNALGTNMCHAHLCCTPLCAHLRCT